MRAELNIERIIPRAAELPMFSSAMIIGMVNEAKTDVRGISYGRCSCCKLVQTTMFSSSTVYTTRRLTGAKKDEKGTPPFRAKPHSCRDAAAREAIPDPVKLIIKTAVIKF